MMQFFGIARYTFREAVRNKILYSILFFAVALIGLAVAIGGASLSQDERILKDVGRFALHFFADIIAIFLGVTMVYQELERKTIYNVLSKPVARHTYFLGKFAGMAFTLAVQVGVMTSVLVAVMAARGDSIGLTFFYGVFLAYVECLMVLSFALFFASFSTPYVSGFLALGMWVVGALSQNLSEQLSLVSETFRPLARGLAAILPDLSLFNLSTQITYDIYVPLRYVFEASAYGFCYGGVFLICGALIFSRRDFV